jgi:hypothetical protein
MLPLYERCYTNEAKALRLVRLLLMNLIAVIRFRLKGGCV